MKKTVLFYPSYIKSLCKLFKDVLENKTLDNTEQKNLPLLDDLKHIWKRPEIEILYQTFQSVLKQRKMKKKKALI